MDERQDDIERRYRQLGTKAGADRLRPGEFMPNPPPPPPLPTVKFKTLVVGMRFLYPGGQKVWVKVLPRKARAEHERPPVDYYVDPEEDVIPIGNLPEKEKA